MIDIHIKGIDAVVRELRALGKDMEDAIGDGCEQAGQFLVDKIKETIDSGAFTALSPATIEWETRMGSPYASDPLKYTLELYNSFYYKTSVSSRKHVVWIRSDCAWLPYHVYGIGVPMRDPFRPTVKEHGSEVIDIIRDAVYSTL